MGESVELTKDGVYRDSKRWYLEEDAGSGYNRNLVKFCQKLAGKKILDFGCATGIYCVELGRRGFDCVGVDINKEYIEKALQKGVKAFVIEDGLPFADKSFDTVIMFEMLEHVKDPGKLLREAMRVAKKNILITVPSCTGFNSLKEYRLTYNHFLDLDHKNFFSKKSLERLLSKYANEFTVEEKEPILLGKAGLPWFLRKIIALLYRMNIIKTHIYYRLFAVIELGL